MNKSARSSAGQSTGLLRRGGSSATAEEHRPETLSLLEWAPPPSSPKNFTFNGPEYRPEEDKARLTGQALRVRSFMLDGAWRTVSEISESLGDPAPSVSAQLRHLRKPRFGSYIIERRSRGDRKRGLFEYRLLAPDPTARREHGAESKLIIQGLRRELERAKDELRLLRSASRSAAEVLDGIDFSEDERAQSVIQVLKDRIPALLSGSEVAQ